MIDRSHDVPSGIDLRTPGDATAWADEADRKRPWRAQFRTAIAALVQARSFGPQRILELGPGPGFLAEVVLQTCSASEYTLFDFSPPFLEMSRARLASPHLRFVIGDFTQETWPDLLSPPYDAILAMQSVHEIRHKRHLPGFYAQVIELLSPTGLFVVCDHWPMNDTPRQQALYATIGEQHRAMRDASFEAITSNLDEQGLYICSANRPARSQ